MRAERNRSLEHPDHGSESGCQLKILCLGAGGFIGSHLSKRLLSDGHTLIGLDMHSDKVEDVLGHDRLTFLEKDIREGDIDLDRLVLESDLVVDLIAYANPGVYVERPMDVFRLNFTENLRIAEACVRHKRRLVQFSSCEVYGKTPVAALRETLPDPENPAYATFAEETSDFILGPLNKHRWIYACAKQLLERVLHAYGLEGKLCYTIIRPFNFIGPKIDYLPGEAPGIPRVFSFFMEALLQGRPLPLVDGGEHRRCYCYIDDAVECLSRVVVNPGGACDQQVFNVGAPGNETSIRGLAGLMRRIYAEKFAAPGDPIPETEDVPSERFCGRGYEDSDRRIPDISKVRTLLGWEPKFGLRDMLELTMAYYVNGRGPKR
jgi:UDP-apiose/xylose synthase